MLSIYLTSRHKSCAEALSTHPTSLYRWVVFHLLSIYMYSMRSSMTFISNSFKSISRCRAHSVSPWYWTLDGATEWPLDSQTCTPRNTECDVLLPQINSKGMSWWTSDSKTRNMCTQYSAYCNTHKTRFHHLVPCQRAKSGSPCPVPQTSSQIRYDLPCQMCRRNKVSPFNRACRIVSSCSIESHSVRRIDISTTWSLGSGRMLCLPSMIHFFRLFLQYIFIVSYIPDRPNVC